MKAVRCLITCATMLPVLAVRKDTTAQAALPVKDIPNRSAMAEGTAPEMELAKAKAIVNALEATVGSSARSAPKVTLMLRPLKAVAILPTKYQKSVNDVTAHVPHPATLRDQEAVTFAGKATPGTRKPDVST